MKNPLPETMTVTLGDVQLLIPDPQKKVSDCTPEEIQAVFKLVPGVTVEQLVHLLWHLDKEKRTHAWRSALAAVHGALAPVLGPSGADMVQHWNRILDEYVDFKNVQKVAQPIPTVAPRLFNIDALYSSLFQKENDKKELAIRLIDVKLNYCFLWANSPLGYEGAFQIVGHNNLEKVTPEAVGWLGGLIQKVISLSILAEKTLDLVEFVLHGKTTDKKKGKWEEKLEKISEYLEISEADQRKLLAFKDYRNAELHKLSSVRAMTAKSQWNHFDDETKLIEELLAKLYAKVTTNNVASKGPPA